MTTSKHILTKEQKTEINNIRKSFKELGLPVRFTNHRQYFGMEVNDFSDCNIRILLPATHTSNGKYDVVYQVNFWWRWELEPTWETPKDDPFTFEKQIEELKEYLESCRRGHYKHNMMCPYKYYEIGTTKVVSPRN